jgi:hypothetical protein
MQREHQAVVFFDHVITQGLDSILSFTLSLDLGHHMVKIVMRLDLKPHAIYHGTN